MNHLDLGFISQSASLVTTYVKLLLSSKEVGILAKA